MDRWMDRWVVRWIGGMNGMGWMDGKFVLVAGFLTVTFIFMDYRDKTTTRNES